MSIPSLPPLHIPVPERHSLPAKVANLWHVIALVLGGASTIVLILLLLPGVVVGLGVVAWGPSGLGEILIMEILPAVIVLPFCIAVLWHWASGHFRTPAPPFRLLTRFATLLAVASTVQLPGVCLLIMLAQEINPDDFPWTLVFKVCEVVATAGLYLALISIPCLIWANQSCQKQMKWIEDESFGKRVSISVPLYKLFGHFVLLVGDRKYELRLPQPSSRIPVYNSQQIEDIALQVEKEELQGYMWTDVGWTRYSHTEIERVCEDIMRGFGTYNLFRRNCRHFLEAVCSRILHVGYNYPGRVPDADGLVSTYVQYVFIVIGIHLEDLFVLYCRSLIGKDWDKRQPTDAASHIRHIRRHAQEIGLYFPQGLPGDVPSADSSEELVTITSDRDQREGSSRLAWLHCCDCSVGSGPEARRPLGEEGGGPADIRSQPDVAIEGVLVDIDDIV